MSSGESQEVQRYEPFLDNLKHFVVNKPLAGMSVEQQQKIVAVSVREIDAVLHLICRYFNVDRNYGITSCHFATDLEEHLKERQTRRGTVDTIVDFLQRKTGVEEFVMKSQNLNHGYPLPAVKTLMVPIFMNVEIKRWFTSEAMRNFNLFTNVECHHFALALFLMDEKRVFYIDSCHRKPFDIFYAIKKKVEEVYKLQFKMVRKSVCDEMINKQQDRLYCATHLLICAEQLLLDGGKTSRINPDDLHLYRQRYDSLMHDLDVRVSNVPDNLDLEKFKTYMSHDGKLFVKKVEHVLNNQGQKTGSITCTYNTHAEIAFALSNLNSYDNHQILVEKVLPAIRPMFLSGDQPQT